MQDGSGLDEAFGGYQNHHNIYIAELFKNGSYKAKKALQEYANNWGMDINSARFSVDSELKHNITSIDGTVPVRPDLLRPDFLSAHSIQLHSKRFESTGDAVRDAFIDYLQVSKIPRNMRMKDRTSMAFGIELRVPFLDHHLVEYALNLPPSFHFHQGYSKSVVRKALTGAMDEAVRLAPKRSIQAPQGLWLMQEPMRSYVENLINSESFADRGVFDVKKVKSSFEEFCSGKYDNSFFVWQWINLEEWFRIFIDNNSVEDVFSFR
jgi:asparagine synthase (glutamine-hydrolysing)